MTAIRGKLLLGARPLAREIFGDEEKFRSVYNEDLQREMGLARIIKLASNENPLGPSPKAVAALAGGLDLSPLITHTFKIDQAREAMAVAADRSSGSSKVMLQLR